MSITSAYVALLEKNGRPAGVILRELKKDINKPLAAILTLNTIAHTIGAAGAGAQAAKVFGDVYLGIISAILTLLILVFSEIIPKTLGAYYWKVLAPMTAYCLHVLVKVLYPFVWLSQKLTKSFTEAPTLRGFNRKEFMALAEISTKEGLLAERELKILKNLLVWREFRVNQAMTPRTVIFSISQDLKVSEYFHKHGDVRFSRIPVYDDDPDDIVGFVLRNDLLVASARNNNEKKLREYRREIPALLEFTSLSKAIDEFIKQKAQIMLVVNEYGVVLGILTMEDLLETLLGLEIVDEGDKTEDMQLLARKLARRKAKKRNE